MPSRGEVRPPPWAAWLAAGALLMPQAGARAGCRMEGAAWSDSLGSMACLATRRNLTLVAAGGVTIEPGPLTWTWPADQPFSGGTLEPTVEVQGRGAAGEAVTLWQRVLEPGRSLGVATTCVPVGVSACPGDSAIPPALGRADGLVHRDDPATPANEGLAGFPGFAGGRAPGAGWDTEPGPPSCAGGGAAAGVYGGISPFAGAALIWGGGLQDLAAGRRYAASFLASANHDGTPEPYLGFEIADRVTNRVAAGWTVPEDSLALPFSTVFSGMTAVSVGLEIPAGAAVWDVRVRSLPGADSHCTLLGPVYVTAQEGAMVTPVFDSLSEATAWQRVAWDVDQNSAEADPACRCPGPGSPITPVRVEWGVGPAPGVVPATPVPGPVADRGQEPVPGTAVGRYAAVRATLYGREAAGAVSPMLAVSDVHRHFAGWRPTVRRLSITYFARAAEAVSRPIAPASLKRWGGVTWDAETPGASRVVVDVVDPHGAVLFAAIPRAVTLADSLDPFTWPVIALRVRLECDPADPALRPVFKGWRVAWTPLPERLVLNRSALRPGRGETVAGLVAVEREGRVRVRVHNAAGVTLAVLLDGWHDATAAAFSWDGRGRDGTAVTPGNYLVSCSTPGGAGTRKLVVER